jgi:hypothetical protein
MVWKSRRDESLQSPDIFWETKELFGNWLDDQIVIFRSSRVEGGPKYFPGMNEFNDLTKFINCFADILNAVNFHSIHSKIIGSNDIFLGIIKE